MIKGHKDMVQELFAPEQYHDRLQAKASTLPSYTLNRRQLCDLELLINGGFSPLKGFLTKIDYQTVLAVMRLGSGQLWPIPITLDVNEKFSNALKEGDTICLRDSEGFALALLSISDLWRPDKLKEAQAVYGTTDTAHPGVDYLLNQAGSVYIGGRIIAFRLPRHYDHNELRHTPTELQHFFKKSGWNRIVAFQTRNPMHRAHQELTLRAAKEHQANLLIQPVVGMTKPGDVDYFTRVRCYKKIIQRYPQHSTQLSLLPLAMRMAGPREALWHALIRKNYGCTHFIVGRDHAGPGKDGHGNDFYGPYDAQTLVAQHEDELGIKMVPFQEMVFTAEKQEYMAIDQVTEGDTVLRISGTEFRRKLHAGENIPEWFSYPDILEELRRAYPPKHSQGFTVFFTGLSGAGKSTIANALIIRLMELDYRPTTLLDGDLVRQNLSSELNFSKEHRDINIKRIGFVASQITKIRAIAICAPIAPYSSVRRAVRSEVEQYGGFVEVHVSTSLFVCEARDTKGLYKKARSGLIKGFTGIDDPYEEPENAEVTIDTNLCSVEQAVDTVIQKLVMLGYLELAAVDNEVSEENTIHAETVTS
jgi:sulfate adenylyltransferase